MKQYILTPNEAKVLSTQWDDSETSTAQLAVRTRLLPRQMDRVVSRLQAKGLVALQQPTTLRLTDEGLRVRKVVQTGVTGKGGPAGVIGPTGSGVIGSQGSSWGGLLGSSSDQRVLILPGEEDFQEIPSEQQLDVAIDRALKDFEQGKEA
jgi:hypothetical protein